MKRLLLPLLLLTASAHATLPTDPVDRPTGFENKYVEGVRLKAKPGCAYSDFKAEVIARSTHPDWPYRIIRHNNRIIPGTTTYDRYAVVYSFKDSNDVVVWGTAPNFQQVQLINVDDGARFNKLRNYTRDDGPLMSSPEDLTNFKFKSSAYRVVLENWYKSMFDNATTCIAYDGPQYKLRLAAVEPSAFANASMGYAAMEQAFPLSAAQKAAAPNVAVIDGQLNTANLLPQTLSRIDTSAPNFINQIPGQPEISSTTTGTELDHASSVVNIITNLSPAPKVYHLAATEGNPLGEAPAAAMTAIEDALKWVNNNAVAKNIKVVNIAYEIPQNVKSNYLYGVMDELKAKGVTIVQADGNDNVPIVDQQRKAARYGSLVSTTGNYVANGAPNIIVGSVGAGGRLTSNYGSQMTDTVVDMRANGAKIQEVHGVLRIQTDLTQENPGQLNFGKTSIASAHVAAFTDYAIAKMPWLTPEQVKIAIADVNKYNTPSYDYSALTQVEIALEMQEFGYVRGGIIDVADTIQYLKDHYGPQSYQILAAPNAFMPLINGTMAEVNVTTECLTPELRAGGVEEQNVSVPAALSCIGQKYVALNTAVTPNNTSWQFWYGAGTFEYSLLTWTYPYTTTVTGGYNATYTGSIDLYIKWTCPKGAHLIPGQITCLGD